MSHLPIGARQKGMNTVQSIVHPVRDLDAAKAIHIVLLGVEPHTDQPYYVGFNVGAIEIGLDPHGRDNGPTAPIAYIQVADLETSFAEVLAAGATSVSTPHDVGGGTRIATVADPDGNVLGLIQKS